MHRAHGLITMLLCVFAEAALGATARYTIQPDTLRADAEGMWRAQLVLENRGELGIMTDSLVMTLHNLDPDSSDAPRSGTRPLHALARVMAPVSAGETSSMDWSSPREFVRGELTLTLYVHDSRTPVIPLTARAVVIGSDLDEEAPSRILGKSGDEVITLYADTFTGPTPAVVWLTESGQAARSRLRSALALRARGWTTVIVSSPGWGLSNPASAPSSTGEVAALAVGIRSAMSDPRIDSERVVVWGVDRSAATALRAASHEPRLAGVIAINPDLGPTVHPLPNRTSKSKPVRTLPDARNVDGDSASTLESANRIESPVLIIRTADSTNPDSLALQDFVTQRRAAGLSVEWRGFGEEPRPVHRRDAQRIAMDFVTRRSRSAHP